MRESISVNFLQRRDSIVSVSASRSLQEELAPPSPTIVYTADDPEPLVGLDSWRSGDFEPIGNNRLSKENQQVETTQSQPHSANMSTPTREEMHARLEASEARVATAVEGMRADVRVGLADIRALAADIRSMGDKSQAQANSFYADAGKVLAEIRLQGQTNRSDTMAMGYKFLTWLFGAAIALGGLYFTVTKALKDAERAQPAEIIREARPQASSSTSK